MVLAHHLHDVITKHRASKSPLISFSGEVATMAIEAQLPQERSERVILEQKSSVDVETLRSMFEARDIALNKLISSTTALAQTSDTINLDSDSSPTSEEQQRKESNVESLKCISCQEIISCSFPPLRSAVAAYRRSQLNPLSLLSSTTIPGITPLVAADLEPKYTNWTTDFVGSGSLSSNSSSVSSSFPSSSSSQNLGLSLRFS
jgi:hypothetical protein